MLLDYQDIKFSDFISGWSDNQNLARKKWQMLLPPALKTVAELKDNSQNWRGIAVQHKRHQSHKRGAKCHQSVNYKHLGVYAEYIFYSVLPPELRN